MDSTFRISFCAGGLFAVMIGLWLAQLWQAEKQVRLHSEHFVRQLEKRNWSAASEFIANNYHDDWNHDRRAVLNRLQIVLRFFSSLTINQANPQVSENSPAGWWSAKVKLQGSGTDFAPEIISRVNNLTEPFVLQWRRESWRRDSGTADPGYGRREFSFSWSPGVPWRAARRCNPGAVSSIVTS
jgi:hypothetical protein